MSFELPQLNKEAFSCPNCQAFAHQVWEGVYGQESRIPITEIKVAKCDRCKKINIWHNWKMLFPEATGIPNPNQDLNEDIKKDYLEAASIFDKSPRGAAALLRLAIQKVCQQLGQPGENINDDIAALVKNGLSPKIQQALDIVRVVGNETVHPGTIDLNDNKDTALQLFKLVNIIAETMITQPREIQSMYDSLPSQKLDAIKQRDS